MDTARTCHRTLGLAAWLAIACVAEPVVAQRPTPSDASFDDQVRRRARLAVVHRAMGITTWVSLAATTTWGTLRYANVVGFGDPLCAPGGSPIFGRDFGCGDGHRIWHLVSASFTTASYAVTRILAALMPDPYVGDESSEAPFGRRLAWHRILSWAHLVGMIAMPVLGFAVSETDAGDARDALAAVHLVTGYATLGVLSAAALLMIF